INMDAYAIIQILSLVGFCWLCPYLIRALLRPVKETSIEILVAGILAALLLICSGIAATTISLLKPYFDHGLQIIAPLAAIGSALNGSLLLALCLRALRHMTKIDGQR